MFGTVRLLCTSNSVVLWISLRAEASEALETRSKRFLSGYWLNYLSVVPRTRGTQKLRPLAPQRVQAPRAGAGKREIEKHEAVEDGRVTAVEDREKSARRVAEKIRKCHL